MTMADPKIEEQAQKVIEAIIRQPDLAMEIARKLGEIKFVGPWQQTNSITFEREEPDGFPICTVQANSEGKVAAFYRDTHDLGATPHVTRLTRHYAEAMDICDAYLLKMGHTHIVGSRPNKITTIWTETSTNNVIGDLWTRHHDIPGKLTWLPLAAEIKVQDGLYHWHTTVQSEQEADGYSRTLDKAKEEIDEHLQQLGWLTPGWMPLPGQH